jgi:deazaflavin-dependent oxidoreductase (nitroreductase family)
VRAVGHKRFAGPLRRSITAIDRGLYRITRGRYLSSAMARIESLVLLVDSPKGIPFVVPLQYVVVDSAVVVIGTNWGRATHPRWTRWLIDDPRCVVNIRGQETPARAEFVDGADREELWPKIVDSSAYYGRVERISGRRLRVFRLQLERPTGSALGRRRKI